MIVIKSPWSNHVKWPDKGLKYPQNYFRVSLDKFDMGAAATTSMIVTGYFP